MASDPSIQPDSEGMATSAHPPTPKAADKDVTVGKVRLRSAPGEKRGDFLGPYKLLDVLGEGGFGRVWLAERREPHVQRVALKVIKPGMDTRSVIARFEQERQALAVMDHPNVARVFDAGASEGGRPYFVMEYVQGEPITDYCNRHTLDIRRRIELFIPVCEAVQHAHMKGIIHRDIKPTNVMVAVKDGSPIPKVIDFGVSKAISHTLTDKSLFTLQGQLIGTPEYMSPEQAEMGGTDIDTRTDVYSLGVVLYELLTGLLPFEPRELRSKGYAEIQRIIREVDPPRPSTRLSRAVSRADTRAKERRTPDPDAQIEDHPRETDAIEYALAQAEAPAGKRVWDNEDRAPDVERTHKTPAQSLVRELRRELEWLPLKAMEKDRTRRYATPKEFADDLRRYLEHKLVHAAPPGVSYRLRKLAYRYRGGVAIACVIVIAAVFGAVVTLSGWSAASRAVLKASEADRQRELAEQFAERSVEIAGNPLVFADEGQLRKEWSAIVGDRRGKFGADDPKTVRAEALLMLLDWTSAMKAYDEARGASDETLKALKQPLRLLSERARKVLPKTDSARIGLANAVTQAALYCGGSADEIDAGYRDLHDAIAAARGPADTKVLYFQVQRAYKLAEARRWDDAAAVLSEYVVSRKANTVTPDRSLVAWHDSMTYLLSYAREQIKDSETITSFMTIRYEDAMAVYAKDSKERQDASLAYARLLAEQGKHGDAERVCAEALRDEKSDSFTMVPRAILLLNLGVARLELGRHAEAGVALRQAMDRIESLLGKDGHTWSRAIGRYGEVLAASGEYAKAETMMLEASTGLSEPRGGEWITRAEIDEERNRSPERLAKLYDTWGKPESAAQQRKIAIDRKQAPALKFYQASKATESGNNAAATVLLRSIADHLALDKPVAHPQRVGIDRLVVTCLYETGELDEALTRAEASLAAIIDAYGHDHSAALRIRMRLAAILNKREDVNGARDLLETIISDVDRTQSAYSHAARDLALRATEFYTQRGPPEAAERWRKAAQDYFSAVTAPRNLGFEEGDLNERPPGWSSTGLNGSMPDFAWLSKEEARHGENCVVMATLDGFSSIPEESGGFRNLMQVFDAAAWAGKKVRLSAAIRAACPAQADSAAMWIRIDLKDRNKPSILSNMGDTRIRTDEWKEYQIIILVPPDASLINIGVMAHGGATVRVDDVKFEIVP